LCGNGSSSHSFIEEKEQELMYIAVLQHWKRLLESLNLPVKALMVYQAHATHGRDEWMIDRILVKKSSGLELHGPANRVDLPCKATMKFAELERSVRSIPRLEVGEYDDIAFHAFAKWQDGTTVRPTYKSKRTQRTSWIEATAARIYKDTMTGAGVVFRKIQRNVLETLENKGAQTVMMSAASYSCMEESGYKRKR
jgi:hypothetical protein